MVVRHRQPQGLSRSKRRTVRHRGAPPDDFLLNQLDLYPDRVAQCIREQRGEYRKPELTYAEFVTRLVLNIGTPCMVLTTLSRADFGITAWKSVIGDEVELRIEAEAVRERAPSLPTTTPDTTL